MLIRLPPPCRYIDGLPDVDVRAGETVIWSDWSMARMPEVWGEDCLEFKPERFLEESEDGRMRVKEFSQFKFHTFNAGPRLVSSAVLVPCHLCSAQHPSASFSSVPWQNTSSIRGNGSDCSNLGTVRCAYHDDLTKDRFELNLFFPPTRCRYNVLFDDEQMPNSPPTYGDSLTLPCSAYYVRFKPRT